MRFREVNRVQATLEPTLYKVLNKQFVLAKHQKSFYPDTKNAEVYSF